MLSIKDLHLEKLEREFYERETLDVAKELLGKYLINTSNGNLLISKITETEAYKENDKAAHFYGGKRTQRTEVIFGKGGVAYVYLIYGMYCCFNVVTDKEGTPGAVLIRKLEPIYGIEQMMLRRKINNTKKIKNLCDGPGKLCIAMDIKREDNGVDLTGDKLYIAKDIAVSIIEPNIKCGKRINIDYAQECKEYLWRFYL